MEARTCLYTFFNMMSLKEEYFFLYFSLFHLKKGLFNSILKSTCI